MFNKITITKDHLFPPLIFLIMVHTIGIERNHRIAGDFSSPTVPWPDSSCHIASSIVLWRIFLEISPSITPVLHMVVSNGIPYVAHRIVHRDPPSSSFPPLRRFFLFPGAGRSSTGPIRPLARSFRMICRQTSMKTSLMFVALRALVS